MSVETHRSNPALQRLPLSLDAMRNQMFHRIDAFFRHYLKFCAAMWVFYVLFHLVMALVVFPTIKSLIWYGLAGATIGCIAAMVLFGLLKALFHKKVLRALAAQKGPNA